MKMKIISHWKLIDSCLNRYTDQYPYWANWFLTAVIYFWLRAFLTVLAVWTLCLCHFSALSLLLFSKSSTRVSFPHPTWLDKSPNLQNFLKLLNLTALKASGTTCLFLVSYGAGTPSKIFSLARAAAPMAFLCGSIPLTLLQNILEGAL